MPADPILSSALNTINLEEIKREMGPPPWWRQVVLSDYVLGTVICQTSAVATDNHVHDYDEWWLVLEGEIHWLIEHRGEPVRAKAGRLRLRARRSPSTTSCRKATRRRSGWQSRCPATRTCTPARSARLKSPIT